MLGLKQHFIINSQKLKNNRICPRSDFLLSENTSHDDIHKLFNKIEGLIFVENPGWHPLVVPTAKKLGIKTVCIVNWEWFNSKGTDWSKLDCLVAPTNYTARILNKFGFKNTIQLDNPVSLENLPERNVEGFPRLFVHNAGLIDHDDRKSTKLVVESFQKTKQKDIKLLINCQKDPALEFNDKRIEIIIGNKKSKKELYESGDVLIQPSKMEGLGLSILEGVCCGIPVISSNYPPMNQWVWHKELLVKTKLFKKKSFSNKAAGISQAYLKIPSQGHLTKIISWCAKNEMDNFSKKNREWAIKHFNASTLKKSWQDKLELFFND